MSRSRTAPSFGGQPGGDAMDIEKNSRRTGLIAWVVAVLSYRSALAMGVCLAVVLLAGCGADSSPSLKRQAQSQVQPRTDLPQSSEPVELDPADFTADITNPYTPWKPGTRWVYREVGGDGEQLQVVITATSVTRRIAN